MNILATRLNQVKESPTFAMMARAAQLKKNGIKVISLAAGEPDFDTPQIIKEAAINAINNGKTKYTLTNGTVELRTAIVNKLQRENNLNYNIEQVIVSTGAKQALYSACQALLNNGDEVIIPAPYWVSYPDMVKLAGGVAISVVTKIENNYKLTAVELNAVITPKSKILILNSPNNPSGMVYSKNELNSLAIVLRQYPQLIVISDEIYEHIIYAGQTFYNILNVAPDLVHRVLIVNGVSKSYAMTGWRIGYLACTDLNIINAIDIIQSQSTSCPCSISQAAASAALNSNLESIKFMLNSFTQRAEYVYNQLRSLAGIKILAPQGAFYLFLNCEIIITHLFVQKKINAKNDIALADYLLDQFFLATVCGSAFGLNNHLRISYAISMEELIIAMERMNQAFFL